MPPTGCYSHIRLYHRVIVSSFSLDDTGTDKIYILTDYYLQIFSNKSNT